MSESVIDPLSPEVADSYDLLRVDCGLFPVDDVAVIELTGEDRKGWLQGQATNNMRSMDLGASSAFCLCAPTGQIIAICELWSLVERFIITLPKEALPAFLQRVEQMVVLEDVVAKVLDDIELVSIQGPGATYRLGGILELPKLDAGEVDFEKQRVVLLRSNRAGLGGWDILVPKGASKARAKLTADVESIHPEAAEIIRIEAGIPKFGVDTNAKTMPPELGPAFDARHVSYNKGCYTGQEVLMRIKSRGHTNRTWVGLLAESPLEPGAVVNHPKRADAGVVTSAAYSPAYGFIGAAMVRTEVDVRSFVTVETSNGSVQAEVREMPILRFE